VSALQRAVQVVDSRLAESGELAALDGRCPGLGAVVGRCLRVNPAERYAQVSEVDAALQLLETGMPRDPSVVDWLQGVRVQGGEAAGEEVETLEMLPTSPPKPRLAVESVPEARTNLAPEPNAFVGRAVELSKLEELLGSGRRLVTVLGPPGTGKTRLVKRFGAQWLAAERVSSVWFFDLTEARTAIEVLSVVAGVLQVPLKGKVADEAILTQRLGQALKGHGPILLLMDNAEQVAEMLGRSLKRWWEQAPQACVVVTSRVPLRLEMEQQFPVNPLPLPGEDAESANSEAVVLFVERARAVQPTFALTADNRADVEAIVRELDGLPLAIELAAARVRMWAPKRLRARLSDRFRLLSRPGSASPSRRRATLQGALDVSWELLQPWEQAALAQCSVFRGGFDWEGVEAVVDLVDWPQAPWTVDVVAALVEHSLVMVDEDVAGERRLRLLVSVQAYGAGKLDEMGWTVVTERRHASHYATFGTAENLEALHRHGGMVRKKRLVVELENLVVATERANSAGWAEEATKSCLAALSMLEFSGPLERGVELAERVLAKGVWSNAKASVHSQVGFLNLVLGNLDESAAHFEEGLRVARKLGDRVQEYRCLGGQATVFHLFGSVKEAEERYKLALTAMQGSDSHIRAGRVLGNYALLVADQGRWDEASALYADSIAVARKVGDSSHELNSLYNLGNLHLHMGQMDKALQAYEQVLSALKGSKRSRMNGVVFTTLSIVYHQMGKPDEALSYTNRAYEIHRRVGDRRWEGLTLVCRGTLYFEQGREEEGVADCNEALRIFREIDGVREEGSLLGQLAFILACQSDFSTAYTYLTRGESLLRHVNDQLEIAKLLCHRGQVELLAKNATAAAAALTEAESIATELNLLPTASLAQKIAALRTALSEANG